MFKQIIRLLNRFRCYADDSAILIYQMAKVGSSALENAIPGSVHLHTLYMNGPCDASDRYIYRGVMGFIAHWSRDCFKRMALKMRRKVKIITIVRDPVKRNVSMFFQGISFWMSEYIDKYDRETREADIYWLQEVFFKTFNHSYCDDWFDLEIKRFTGIDIYDERFDKDRGYCIYEKGKFSVMVLRAEDIERHIDKIEIFIGKKLNMKQINKAEDKWYGSVYKNFISTLDDSHPAVVQAREGRVAKFFGYSNHDT